jgi:deoxyribose-phosphate aldolase
MRLTPSDLARLIDISAVRTQHGEAEIRELVRRGREHRFIALHVLPCWVRFLREQLAGAEGILVGAPVGFPSGAHTTGVKVAEIRGLVADGVDEADMMLNVGKLRSGRDREVLDDIRAVVDAAGAVPIKVILEVHCLTPEEVKRACALAIEGGAAFVKTSTGWVPWGATLEIIELITSFVGDRIRVKASGGVRSLATVRELLRLGVSRFGINLDAATALLRECAESPGGAIEVEARRPGADRSA